MKKILLSPWTALITLVLILSIRITDPGFVESVRLRYFDQLVTSQPAKDVPVHVVNIDEASLDKYGQYPFSRDVYAAIIKDLYARQAGLVVFNILMPEADRFKQDPALAKIMQAHPVVLPTVGNIKPKNTPQEHGVSIMGQHPQGLIVEFPGLIANTPVIEKAAAGVGIVNTFPEVDGVVRRTPLVIYSNEKLYPSLALEALRVAAGDPSFQIKIGEAGVEALRIPQFGKITTDSLSRVWIDWAATPKQYSLVELPKTFNNEIVIVGVSAVGLANPVATSKGEVMPQDLQAAALGTMMTGSTIQRPEWADYSEMLAMLVAGVLVIFFGIWKRT